MVGDLEVAECAERHLADAIGRAILHVGELTVLGHLAASECRPAAMLERRFGRDRIVGVAVCDLASPGECSGELPARRNLARVERAGRPTLLVDSRLELFGIGEMAPAALKRERASRVP